MGHTDPYSWLDVRRLAPRIEVEAFCSELVGGRDQPAMVIDLGPAGMRLERPYVPGPTPHEVVFELEVPAVDEVIWARGEVCFDRIRQAPAGQGGGFGLLRTTGLRLVTAAARDLRLLRDCVFELRRRRELALAADAADAGHGLLDASCYARG